MLRGVQPSSDDALAAQTSAAGSAADTDGMTETSKAESADWALFTGRCVAAKAPGLPTNLQVIQAFLDELPAARSTRLVRVHTIRIRHAQLGMPDPYSPAAAPPR